MACARPQIGPSGRSELDGQGGRRTERHADDMRWWGARVEAQIRQPLEQRVDGDHSLHARQVHAEAKVGAAAERQVRDVLAGGIEAVRVGVARRVPVGGRDADADVRSRRDGDPAELTVADRPPHHRGDGRLPAQRLLEGAAEHAAIGLQRVEQRRLG